MKVVTRTGLVPVKSIQTGAIFGVAPAKALEMVKDKLATLVDVPDHIETFEFAVAKQKSKAVEVEEPTVIIPDNWESMHHLQKIKLAKTLSGDDSVKTLKAAEEVIGAEVQRRAAAESPAE